MKYVVCMVPVAPVRSEPDHYYEMTNQILFGEQLLILEETKEGWVKGQNQFDGYIGWVRVNQFLRMEEALPACSEYTADWVNEFYVGEQLLRIPFATNLALLKLENIQQRFNYEGKIWEASKQKVNLETINHLASYCMNTGYLWGGRSVYGIDCSGFVQTVFKMMNISLLRDAKDQATQGVEIPFLQAIATGDVAFFDDVEGKITHVGILLDQHTIVHASGNVRIDKIDTAGIIHSETGLRTHQLRIIKRMH